MKTKLDKIVDVLIESGANNDKIEMYKKLYLAAIEIGFKVEDYDLGKYVVVNNVPHKFVNGKLVALAKKG